MYLVYVEKAIIWARVGEFKDLSSYFYIITRGVVHSHLTWQEKISYENRIPKRQSTQF